ETLKEILEKVKIPIDEIDNVEMEIIKMFPDEYSFNENTLKNKIFDDEKIKKIREDIRDKWGNIKIICNEYEVLDDELFEIDFSNLDYEKIRLIDFKNMISPNLSKITDEKKRELFSKLLNEIQINIDNIISFSNNKTKFLEELKKEYQTLFFLILLKIFFQTRYPFQN
ncbi:MAG: hypothetical protein Q4A30_01885, partial [Candidatus Saccharibacteria bacterium]|nr:hypothetical protein [Candidatus Saccharibacteria bacterium]